jgi:SagB-type dehydrogenase family enzyme
MKKIFIGVIAIFILGSCNQHQESGSIDNLPKPNIHGGKPLMIALRDRRTTREIDSRELNAQQISNLLWAADGINRADGRRTAPSAMNKQEIDIYVALKSGVYLFDYQKHKLNKILADDIRSEIGGQSFFKEAPLALLFVSDYNKSIAPDSVQKSISAINTGYISQNVYLFCASEDLATVAVGSVNIEKMTQMLHLSPKQHITLAQPVGYKK